MYFVLEHDWDANYLSDFSFEEIWYDNDYNLIEGKNVDTNLPPMKFSLTNINNLSDALTNEWGYLIINDSLKRLLENACRDSIQFIEVNIANVKSKYYMVNVLNRFDAVDHKTSRLEIDDYGFINRIFKLVIDSKKIDNYDIFRINEYPSFIVISDKLKDILTTNHITGLKYTPIEDFKL